MRKICRCTVLLAVLAPATAFGYAVDLSIEPGTQSAGIGEVVAYDVWMRNIDNEGGSSDYVGGVDIDFGVLPAGLSFQADASAADGFAENDLPIPTELDMELDGSLLDGHTPGIPDLSYTVGFTALGIPTNQGDRMLGTFWVSADSAGTYPLSLSNNATAVYTDLGESFAISFTDSELVVSGGDDGVIPEPAGLAVAGLAALLVRRRRG